jgi:hypothetical protein
MQGSRVKHVPVDSFNVQVIGGPGITRRTNEHAYIAALVTEFLGDMAAQKTAGA